MKSKKIIVGTIILTGLFLIGGCTPEAETVTTTVATTVTAPAQTITITETVTQTVTTTTTQSTTSMTQTSQTTQKTAILPGDSDQPQTITSADGKAQIISHAFSYVAPDAIVSGEVKNLTDAAITVEISVTFWDPQETDSFKAKKTYEIAAGATISFSLSPSAMYGFDYHYRDLAVTVVSGSVSTTTQTTQKTTIPPGDSDQPQIITSADGKAQIISHAFSYVAPDAIVSGEVKNLTDAAITVEISVTFWDPQETDSFKAKKTYEIAAGATISFSLSPSAMYGFDYHYRDLAVTVVS
jgi:acylphosphatase